MLKRKAPLKSRGQLKTKTPLKSKSPLKTKTGLKQGGSMNSCGQLKAKAPMKRTAMKSSPSKKLTPIQESARGKDCQVRVPGVCNFNSETTVLGHVNGAGTGTKNDDLFAAFVCSDCHSWLDGGYAQVGATRAERDLLHLQGVVRTQKIMLEEELVLIPLPGQKLAA